MASITELEQELALANRRLTEIHAQIGRQRRLVHRLERAGEEAPPADRARAMGSEERSLESAALTVAALLAVAGLEVLPCVAHFA